MKRWRVENWPLWHTATNYFEVWERFIVEHNLLPVHELLAKPTQNDSSHALFSQFLNFKSWSIVSNALLKSIKIHELFGWHVKSSFSTISAVASTVLHLAQKPKYFFIKS